MIYTESQMLQKLNQFMISFEDEIVEFKTAESSFSFNELGEYFSALSNEANLRGKQEGWLFFGITNDKAIKGTVYRKDGGLQGLKKDIASHTNDRLTFYDIYELEVDKKRIVAFQIPPAIRGIPTSWNGAAWSREHESLAPLSLNKLDLIRSQIGTDWSKEIVNGATLQDLDEEAIRKARSLFAQKQDDEGDRERILHKYTDIEVLNKAGLLIKGQVTRTALILLGKKEAGYFFDGFVPRITWTLYNGDGLPKAYEHFDMPLLLAVDKVYAKIRNEKYQYILGQQTLFPEEVFTYDAKVIKELLNNCIVHSDYRLRGKINVEEFEDRLVFINEGSFIPETIEAALTNGYKAPYYRNSFLGTAMVNLYMIDTNSMGIQRIYNIQREKCFPLPTYDLEQPNRVSVTLYGKVLNENYSQLLYTNDTLDLMTVFLLDKIQKREPISKVDFLELKKQGLSEGRYPNIYVSYKVADMVDQKKEYVKAAGLTDEICMQLIKGYLGKFGESKASEITEAVEDALPGQLSKMQKRRKVSNILQKMKKNGMADTKGKGAGALWFILYH